jgi:hypothetical protein
MARIDTLAKYREFLSAGYTEQQAEVAVKAFAEAEDIAKDDLVTKAELKLEMSEFRQEIREDFLVLRQEFRGVRWLTISFGSVIIGCLLLPIKEILLNYVFR